MNPPYQKFVSEDVDQKKPKIGHLSINVDEALSPELKKQQQGFLKCTVCCGIVTALILIIAVVMLVLGFTALHVKHPKIKMNSVAIIGLIDRVNSTDILKGNANLTMVAVISVKNTNVAAFKFEKSNSSILYHETVVGVVDVPGGVAKARRTIRLKLAFELTVAKIAVDPQFRSDITVGKLILQSYTRINVGPITTKYEPVGLKSNVIEWLDQQPEKTVIYVSFGSGGTISAEQLTELAWGLEMSHQRFVWVVRPAVGRVRDGSFFKSGQSSEPNGQYDFLPEGFVSRTQKVGLVVPSWAPHVEIVNHSSVGGFLTHCGWNSTLESISSGVAMIAWALYAEQKMNATMLTEELKVELRPKVLPTKKVVGRDEVEKMVRDLMEGEEAKTLTENVKRLKEDAEEALSAVLLFLKHIAF